MKGNMHEEIKIKNVIFYSVVIILTIILIKVYFSPGVNIKFNVLNKHIEKINSSQTIAPQRLFVKVWRSARNEYVDSSMNNQNWLKWRNRYLRHIKTADDAEVAIDSMLASLNDPYTRFLNSSEFAKQKDILESKYTGVGIIFNKTGDSITINHVLKNSPASKENVLPGDKILSINGQNVNKLSAYQIFNMPQQKSVHLVLKRGEKVIKKDITRNKIPIETVYYKVIDGQYAIIMLSTIMGEKTVSDFIDVIKKTNDLDGIIFDLRDNFGGVLANAVEMANFMLEDERITSIESGNNEKLQIYAKGEKIFKKKPIIILVNRRTASAAEIFAGALKDNLDAIIVGENTYGKNSIQHIIPLQNNTGLIITSDKYLLPLDEDIHKTGISPDVYIKSDRSQKKDSQMGKAVKILKKIMKNREESGII